MLRFINIHELHARTPQAILWVEKGGKCVVTKRGKPKAILLPLREEEIEDLVLGSSPLFRKVRTAEKTAEKKGWKTLVQVKKELGLE